MVRLAVASTARLATGVLIAMAAICLGAASTAAATGENPLFLPASGQSIAGTSSTSILYAGGHLIVCGKDVYTGAVSTALLVGNAKIHYLGCVSLATPTSATHCAVNSSGATGGLILWSTLHGVLGLILPSKRTGILLLPQTGATFTTVAKNECTPETKVTGNVAGEYSPVGLCQTTAKIAFALTAGAANPASVKDFDLTHSLGLVKPELVGFSEAGGVSQTEEIEYSVATEVT
jgi:hypothetical protein